MAFDSILRGIHLGAGDRLAAALLGSAVRELRAASPGGRNASHVAAVRRMMKSEIPENESSCRKPACCSGLALQDVLSDLRDRGLSEAHRRSTAMDLDPQLLGHRP